MESFIKENKNLQQIEDSTKVNHISEKLKKQSRNKHNIIKIYNKPNLDKTEHIEQKPKDNYSKEKTQPVLYGDIQQSPQYCKMQYLKEPNSDSEKKTLPVFNNYETTTNDKQPKINLLKGKKTPPSQSYVIHNQQQLQSNKIDYSENET